MISQGSDPVYEPHLLADVDIQSRRDSAGPLDGLVSKLDVIGESKHTNSGGTCRSGSEDYLFRLWWRRGLP